MTTLSAVLDNSSMQSIRDEFVRLGDRCYLENAGSNLYPKCLMEEVNNDFTSQVYMNPHTDHYTRDCIEQIRVQTLSHFNTDSSKYSVIFTSGTTQALKLIAESFRFHSPTEDDTDCTGSGCFVYLRDNHTSVLGLREIAADKNADIVHISHQEFLNIVKEGEINSFNKEKHDCDGNTLFVYPAESNFNGYKYPLSCIDKIKDGCLNNHMKKLLCKVNRDWYVLIDAACYVPTNKLDLSITQPDFVCMSFYKMFGYPTGIGAVLVKNSSAHVLSQKSYFGGGTVDVVLSDEDYHVRRKNLHESLEDGTIPFLSIIALKHAFNTLYKLVPRAINDDVMDTINHHTFYLAKDLYEQLKGLRHKNGKRAAILYMDSDFSDIREQGGIVTFNIMRDDGSYIGYAEFQHMANLFNIDIRTGCFCNSGSCQRHLKATNKDIVDMYKAGHKCGDEIDLIDGRPTGAIRASFAYYNTFEDVDRMIKLIHKCFLKSKFVKRNRAAPSYRNKVEVIIKPESKYSVNVIEDKGYYKNVEVIPNPIPYIPRMVLEEIAIYPVKSCGAFKINTAWMIGNKGFQYDREWMIANDSGVCLTQKKNTRMCMIQPKIDLKKNVMVLCCKGKRPISVPLETETPNKVHVQVCQSKICTDMITGYDCGDEVADWISEALETSYLRLLRQCSDDRRALKSKEGEKKMLSLSNQAQFLLINKATVRWLAKRIEDESFTDTIDELTDRFRGNLIIDTDDELGEKEWHRVILGRHEFKVEGHCSRCQMVCIDQNTGEKTVEPLRTISKLFAGKLRFGIYLTYIGPVDTNSNPFLQVPAEVIPMFGDDDISR